MSGFTVDWLDLREAADRRARDQNTLSQAKRWLRNESGPTVVDLGAGTGSTLRAFADSEDSEFGSFDWRLVDQDPHLLAEARRRHGNHRSLETCELDLARISELPLSGARLVTASALFDLVSASFIDSLANALKTQRQTKPVGLYAALNYDGATQWTPAHPLDEAVLASFNRDQRRDKGLGPALGPDACDYLEKRFSEAGFEVISADSPWVLDRGDEDLITELIEGVASAVATDPGLDSESLRDWRTFRLANAGNGSCIVGHRDLLALPAAPA